MGRPSNPDYSWAELLRQAKALATAEAVYGPSVGALRSEGAYLTAHCPFHPASEQGKPNERRFKVSKAHLGFKCWHGECGKSGDVLAYLNAGEPVRGPDYKRLVVRLCDLTAVQVPERMRAWAEGKAGPPGAAIEPVPKPPEPVVDIEAAIADIEAREAGLAKVTRLWAESEPIGTDPKHPARAWVRECKPGIWPEAAPFPKAVRWHRMGCLVQALAPLDNWLDECVTPRALQLITPGRNGARDRKTWLKDVPLGGFVTLIGWADGEAPEPLAVPSGLAGCLSGAARERLGHGRGNPSTLVAVEGLADAMAAARLFGYGLALRNANGFTDEAVMADLARAEGIELLAGGDWDADAAKGPAANFRLQRAAAGYGLSAHPLWAGAELPEGVSGYDLADLAADAWYEAAEREAIRTGCNPEA